MACVGNAETRDRTGDLQIFSLTLSQLSYRGIGVVQADPIKIFVWEHHSGPPQFLPRSPHVYISPSLDFATFWICLCEEIVAEKMGGRSHLRAPRNSDTKKAILRMLHVKKIAI